LVPELVVWGYTGFGVTLTVTTDRVIDTVAWTLTLIGGVRGELIVTVPKYTPGVRRLLGSTETVNVAGELDETAVPPVVRIHC
jgi:hypothetical protein